MKVLSAMLILTSLTVLGCGEEPAFNEDLSTKANAGDATAATDTGDTGETDVEGVGDGLGGGDGGTGVAGGGDGLGGGDSGAGGADGGDADGGGGTDTAGADGSGGDDAEGGNDGDDDEVLVEDGGTLEIPGAKVQRVGVNFEDATDFDYNDAVMCFEGNFKIEGTNVVSYQKQDIKVKTFSASGCDHRVDVTVMHADGTKAAFSYRSDSGETLLLPFKIKSRLEVTMTTIDGSCSRTPVTMHDNTYALVKGDVCNNTGN